MHYSNAKMSTTLSAQINSPVVLLLLCTFPNMYNTLQELYGSIQSPKSFQSCDKEAYNTARARVKAGNKEEKRRHQQGLQRDLNTKGTEDMWQGTENVTGYESRSFLHQESHHRSCTLFTNLLTYLILYQSSKWGT